MYSLIRSILFSLDAEKAHGLTLSSLNYIPRIFFPKPVSNVVHAMGIEFVHPIGLAAGVDKNGAYLDALSKLGLAFIEIGTVTPKPQSGNPMPRLFRLPKAQGVINRMGFNNHGVDAMIANLERTHYRGVLGINIGKNKTTALNDAVDDYLYCLRRLYHYASYITVNISSPNTPDLRQLQHDDYFRDLMQALSTERLILAEQHQRWVPLVVKLSPDESDETLKKIAEVIVSLGIEGIIATNTTSDRYTVRDLVHGQEEGGLSGQPVFERSTHCLHVLKQTVGEAVTLIGVGGIDSVTTAQEKINVGATLLQLYTGLLYQGPYLIKELAGMDI